MSYVKCTFVAPSFFKLSTIICDYCFFRRMHWFVLVPSDPCEGKQCGFGAKCVPSTDRKAATCQCQKTCPVTSNKSTKVCGSDGNEYESECHLNSTACTTKTNITVVPFGKCCKYAMLSFWSLTDLIVKACE